MSDDNVDAGNDELDFSPTAYVMPVTAAYYGDQRYCAPIDESFVYHRAWFLSEKHKPYQAVARNWTYDAEREITETPPETMTSQINQMMTLIKMEDPQKQDWILRNISVTMLYGLIKHGDVTTHLQTLIHDHNIVHDVLRPLLKMIKPQHFYLSSMGALCLMELMKRCPETQSTILPDETGFFTDLTNLAVTTLNFVKILPHTFQGSLKRQKDGEIHRGRTDKNNAIMYFANLIWAMGKIVALIPEENRNTYSGLESIQNVCLTILNSENMTELFDVECYRCVLTSSIDTLYVFWARDAFEALIQSNIVPFVIDTEFQAQNEWKPTKLFCVKYGTINTYPIRAKEYLRVSDIVFRIVLNGIHNHFLSLPLDELERQLTILPPNVGSSPRRIAKAIGCILKLIVKPEHGARKIVAFQLGFYKHLLDLLIWTTKTFLDGNRGFTRALSKFFTRLSTIVENSKLDEIKFLVENGLIEILVNGLTLVGNEHKKTLIDIKREERHSSWDQNHRNTSMTLEESRYFMEGMVFTVESKLMTNVGQNDLLEQVRSRCRPLIDSFHNDDSDDETGDDDSDF